MSEGQIKINRKSLIALRLWTIAGLGAISCTENCTGRLPVTQGVTNIPPPAHKVERGV